MSTLRLNHVKTRATLILIDLSHAFFILALTVHPSVECRRNKETNLKL